MTDATAACWDASSFNAGTALRRGNMSIARLAGGAFVGFGTVAVACLPIVAVATAGWLMATTHSVKSRLDIRVPPGPALVAVAMPRSLSAEIEASARPRRSEKKPAQKKPAETAQVSFESRWTGAFGAPAAPRHTVATLAYNAAISPPKQEPVPLPPPHPAPVTQNEPETAAPKAPAAEPARLAAAPIEAPPAPPAPPVQAKSAPVKEAHNRSIALPGRESRTAVYDISARTVYMPNGERLEAHSGLGEKMDNPRYVRVKMRGPTPPNVYDLTLRERLFHGVRAIRLNPVSETKMFGRDGMLAHTYMLGPSGQSNGCVSFKDYSRFLRAYLNGEVTRLVVVPHLGDMPLSVARNGGEDSLYAAAEPPARTSSVTW